MALNFDESVLLILFAQANGSSINATALDNFDDELQDAFGTLLQNTMAAEGLPSDITTRSLVLGCRPHMAGNTAPVQIRNACRYVLKGQHAVGALFLTSEPPSQTPAAGERSDPTPKRKRSKKKPT